ncbi:hypothetical protein [Bosea sp. LjRoot237]|uniref:hypothetical protein n=1 Tax=Bosea sp. LjRoot237 TaxID=3342292 RepID=UPI003ECE5F6D
MDVPVDQSVRFLAAAQLPVRLATVFATARGIENLGRRIEGFSAGNRLGPDGEERPPANADLVQSTGTIVEANLLAGFDSWGADQNHHQPLKITATTGLSGWEISICTRSENYF